MTYDFGFMENVKNGLRLPAPEHATDEMYFFNTDDDNLYIIAMSFI